MSGTASVVTGALDAAGSIAGSFQPLSSHCISLCAFHTYAHDQSRQIKSHHYCNHITEDFHQCIIYDSDKKDARLIGIEYIVTEPIFKTFPEEEKRYWHSHLYEVDSGMLVLQAKSLVPGPVTDALEKPLMAHLRKSYGKTVHTWQIDIHPKYPFGAPQLMGSINGDNQLDMEKLRMRDEEMGIDSMKKREYRREAFKDDKFEVDKAADSWTKGKTPQLVYQELDVKKA